MIDEQPTLEDEIGDGVERAVRAVGRWQVGAFDEIDDRHSVGRLRQNVGEHVFETPACFVVGPSSPSVSVEALAVGESGFAPDLAFAEDEELDTVIDRIGVPNEGFSLAPRLLGSKLVGTDFDDDGLRPPALAPLRAQSDIGGVGLAFPPAVLGETGIGEDVRVGGEALDQRIRIEQGSILGDEDRTVRRGTHDLSFPTEAAKGGSVMGFDERNDGHVAVRETAVTRREARSQ